MIAANYIVAPNDKSFSGSVRFISADYSKNNSCILNLISGTSNDDIINDLKSRYILGKVYYIINENNQFCRIPVNFEEFLKYSIIAACFFGFLLVCVYVYQYDKQRRQENQQNQQYSNETNNSQRLPSYEETIILNNQLTNNNTNTNNSDNLPTYNDIKGNQGNQENQENQGNQGNQENQENQGNQGNQQNNSTDC
jgi:hypothetical protein